MTKIFSLVPIFQHNWCIFYAIVLN